MTTTDDKKRVLKDGERITVPMHLMDGVQQAIAAPTHLTDAYGMPAGHAPGFVFQSSNERTVARDEAYERRSGVLAASWCV